MCVGTRDYIQLRNQQETLKCCASWSDHISKLHFRKITEYAETQFRKGRGRRQHNQEQWSSSKHGRGRGSENGKDGHVGDMEFMESLDSSTDRMKLKPDKLGERKSWERKRKRKCFSLGQEQSFNRIRN